MSLILLGCLLLGNAWPDLTYAQGVHPAYLNVSPGSLSFNAYIGGSNPPPQYIQLTSYDDTGNFNASIAYGSGASGWLSVTPTQGYVISGTTQSLTVQPTVGTLPVGTYNATVTISTYSLAGGNPTVNVTFVVSPQPTATFTAVPPTATFTPIPPTATFTPIPPTITPTATSVPITPTATFTPIPPTATSTATPVPPTATFTPVPPTTNSIPTATTVSINQTTRGQIVANSSVSGQVRVNDKGAAGISLRLNGGNYQQTDANGNYTFNNLTAGTYNLTVLVDPNVYVSLDGDPKASDVKGYNYPPITLAANQNLSSINFNLQTGNATTVSVTTSVPTTTSSPTTAAVTTPTTSTSSVTTSPATTVASSSLTPTPTGAVFNSCTPPPPLANVLSGAYCVTQSPSNPNLFSVNLIFTNNTANNLDLSHTIIIGLEGGTTVQQATSDKGTLAVAPDSKSVALSNLQLAPGQSVSLSLYITTAVNSLTLLQNIQVKGVDTTLNSPFSAILPGLAAQAGRGNLPPIYSPGSIVPTPVVNNGGGNGNAGQPTGQGGASAPSGLPQTGAVVANSSSGNILTLVVILGLIIALALGWLGLSIYHKRKAS